MDMRPETPKLPPYLDHCSFRQNTPHAKPVPVNLHSHRHGRISPVAAGIGLVLIALFLLAGSLWF